MSLKMWETQFFVDKPRWDDVINLAIKAGILAPSTHNSQPWEVVRTSNGIEIHSIHNKLIHSDTQGHYHWVSVGCFVENFIVCIEFYGYEAEVELKNDIVSISVSSTPNKAKDNTLLYQVTRRYSEKRIVKSKPFPKIKLPIHAYGNTAVDLLFDKKKIEEASRIQYEAAKDFNDNKDFAKELSRWLRIRKHHTSGMHHKSSGLSLPKIAVGKFALKVSPKPLAKMAKKYLKLVSASNAIGFISTSGNSPIDYLNAGRTMEHCALLLSANDLSLTPLAALLESTDGKIFFANSTIYPNNKPVLFFRICDRQEPIHHTARRNFEEVVK